MFLKDKSAWSREGAKLFSSGVQFFSREVMHDLSMVLSLRNHRTLEWLGPREPCGGATQRPGAWDIAWHTIAVVRILVCNRAEKPLDHFKQRNGWALSRV